MITKCISKSQTLAEQRKERKKPIGNNYFTVAQVVGAHHIYSATVERQGFELTRSVGANTRNLDYTRCPIRHPVRDIRRRCRIRFVCTRRPTATELVSVGHQLMAVLRRVETPRPLENDKKKYILLIMYKSRRQSDWISNVPYYFGRGSTSISISYTYFVRLSISHRIPRYGLV